MLARCFDQAAAANMAIMEAWDALCSRRNVRSYLDQPIEQADLDRILEAGRRSPSSSNQQRWEFILCVDKERLSELAKVWRGAGHVASSAATIALVAPNVDDPKTRESIQYDLGQATLSMMVAAADLGIGSGHAAVEDQDLARLILGIPPTHFCAWLLAFGYPADRPLSPLRRPNRCPTAEVIHLERW